MLDLADLPAEQRAALRAGAEPAARGYTLLTWDGPAPEDTVDEVAALNGAMADAPREAGQEAQAWDAARVRLDQRRVAAMGVRAHVVAARAPGTGDLAALTQVCVDRGHAGVGIPGADRGGRPHRGHRLGLLLKLAMLDRLAAREPQVTRILTGNADGNQHMIAINEQLGFRVLSRWPSWELDVAERARRIRLVHG